MKAVNHKPMIRPEGTCPLGRRGGQICYVVLPVVTFRETNKNYNFFNLKNLKLWKDISTLG
jgi:hypothetical protein